MEKIILASASPRRREILENLGINFSVFVADCDEGSVSCEGIDIKVYVQELALLKASAAYKSVDEKNALIISADTIVYHDGKVLGKPGSREEAFDMLKSLSGKCHSVYTGICVMRTKNTFSVSGAVETKVYFKNLTDREIEKYIDGGEPMDKAGAYGVQGKGALFVEKIEGDYFNVVGLPVSKLSDILKKEFNYDLQEGECK